MLKVYGQYRSRAFRVIWLCKESNIPYEHVDVTINVAMVTGVVPVVGVPLPVDGGYTAR